MPEFGFWTAIGVMTVVTYLCRIAGYAVMARVPLTPRVRRGLEALPGAIIAAVLVPAGVKAGPAGIVAIGVAIIAARLWKHEFVALGAGLAVIIAARQMGF